MSERLRSDSTRYQSRYPTNSAKMSDGDLGTRKTLFVLVIVVGCFAVLWPKVFYPMLAGPTSQRIKPNSFDKGCCDVISDIDVNAIKIMNELCNNIIQRNNKKPLKGPDIITRCRTEILNKCGIDISAVLQEQVRLGRTFKQIVDEVRSFNGSLCLKYNFGISPWKLGAPHRVTINLTPVYIQQERPAHLRPEMLHPALREKGRAIPHPYHPPAKGSQPKFIDGRPGPVPGIRPPMGAGHVVHSPKSSTNSMGVIMPIYTIGIVIFFSYTLMKLLFKKKPEGPGGNLYPPIEPSMTFRREVFESQKSRQPREPGSIVNAMSALLDEVDQELEARRRANEIASQKGPTSNGTLIGNGSAAQDHDQPSVKVLGMEMTASCEGGQRWSRPDSPVMPNTPPPPPEPTEPPQEIYLEGALPPQSQLLVADSTTQPEPSSSPTATDPAVILASKMTLSVISLDSQENENENEYNEKSKLRNGDLVEPDQVEEDIVDESKYTTASGATAAEHDISEGDRTDDENDIEDIEKIPEYVVDNGAQHIDDSENIHEDDLELNLREETTARPLDDNKSSSLKFLEDADSQLLADSNYEVDFEDEYKQETNIDYFDKNIEDTSLPILSAEGVETIADVIDDIINIGTQVLISDKTEENDNQSNENKPCVKFEEQESSVRFTEDIFDDEDDDDDDGGGGGGENHLEAVNLTPEAIESISDVINDVINIGTRMSEIISAERDADSEEPEETTFDFQYDKADLLTEITPDRVDSSSRPTLEVEPDEILDSKANKDDVNG